jgi:hypothetical protein
MQLTYKLNNDKYIASEIEKTKTKINERKCENENNLFNQYYSKSLKYINTNDFLLARDYLDMAINIAIDNPACNIPLVLASEKKSEFLPAFNYLNLISDAVKEYNTGNYKNVIVNYKTASQYYYDYKINNFSIIYIDFSDFLLMHDKPDFLLFCLNYFIENNMFNEALNTLTILKNNNYNAKETIKYQKKLGLKMAINDKENFKTEKASTLLIKYTGKDKYFRHFRSAYHRTWIKH